MAAAHADPWRLRCPNGHTSWTPKGDHYWCEGCGQLVDDLIDTKQPLRADGGTATLVDLRERLLSQATEDGITIEIVRLDGRLRVNSGMDADGLRLWLENNGCEVVDQRADGSCTVRRGGNDD